MHIELFWRPASGLPDACACAVDEDAEAAARASAPRRRPEVLEVFMFVRGRGLDASLTRDYTEKGARVAAPPTITDNRDITLCKRSR
jgi:hypothetical protein